MADPSTAQPDYTHSLRITFAYDGSNLRIARTQRVAMRAPAVATPPPDDNHCGYWLEVRDGSGRLLYHRPIHDPMQEHPESYGQAPGHPMRRHSTPSESGEFEVIIPDIPGAQTFRLHGPPRGYRADAHPAGRLTTHSVALSEHNINDLRQMASQGGRR